MSLSNVMHAAPRTDARVVRTRIAAILAAAMLAACGGGNGGADGSANAAGGTSSPPSSSQPTQLAIPFAPAADSDAFYQQPDPMPDVPPGTILKSRPITFAPVGAIPLPNAAWQLQFMSRDTNGQPIAAVATVVKPLSAPSGTAPLVAFQYAEDALGNQCAPSHTLSGAVADRNSQVEGTFALTGLNTLGWTLVYPDHEGPSSAYAAGQLAGQITLDSIRAAEQFAPLGLNANTPVGMWGYSGGAIATAWAASLQRTYAPELDIVGAASGGTPADVIGVVRNVDTNPAINAAFFSLILSAVEGIDRAYPQFFAPILNASGNAAFASLANGCVGGTSDGTLPPMGHLADYSTSSDPLDSPNVGSVAPLISLPRAGLTPMADMFIYHSITDELIPIQGVDNMVAQWCAAGAHVGYQRAPAGGDHITFEVASAPNVLSYLSSRFAGGPASVPSGTQRCN